MAIQLPVQTDGLIVLGVYLLGCLGVGAAGFLAKRRAREDSAEDHFLAGRAGLPAPVLLGTVFAQTLSGWALLGYPGAAYREGLGAIKWLAASVAIAIGMGVVNPRLHRLGRSRRWVTPCDLVHARFSHQPGGTLLHGLVCLCMLLPTVFYVLIQFKGLATAIHAVSGGVISGYAGAALAALIMLACVPTWGSNCRLAEPRIALPPTRSGLPDRRPRRRDACRTRRYVPTSNVGGAARGRHKTLERGRSVEATGLEQQLRRHTDF